MADFLRIALPLARPTMAALSIILFLASWNNYLWPLLINSRPGMMTAPWRLAPSSGLTKFMGRHHGGGCAAHRTHHRGLCGFAASLHRRHLCRSSQVREAPMAELSLKNVVKSAMVRWK